VLGTIQDVGYRLLLGQAPSGLPGRVADAAEQSLATLAGVVDLGDPGQAELMVQAREAFTRAMHATAVTAAGILLFAGVMAARHVPAASEESS
jgi:MFS transporter